ncbi:hypothetical protein BAZO_19663 [Schinkia azotoformans LMG 9581]|uniref:Uncharacterized protein n=1 Tax=Schinkia azotoformans LMG 9581 TaxID=1131731 RepID=K6DQH6_SCHAZ|nr:hypothetical protein BAZO_19663 [Schinkia azotoformans LMG 9581]
MKFFRMGILCLIIIFTIYIISDYIRYNSFKLSENLLDSFIYSALLIFFLWLSTNIKANKKK